MYREFQAFGHAIRPIWFDVFTTPATVTTGRPCYNPLQGLRIHQDQTIASFFSKAFRTPVQVDFSRSNRLCEASPFSKVASASACVRQMDESDEMVISFMRTVRIPEDNKIYKLPPSLGNFPLFDVRPFSERLPASMATQGGIFLPMYQLEAMWINFQCKKGRRFVVRPYLGGVNGTTGEHVLGDMASLLRKMNQLSIDQDYIRIWVKGASIEWQVTGRDSVGGIQLQTIPEFDIENISAVSLKDTCVAPGGAGPQSYDEAREADAQRYNALKTPKELGLLAGSAIHLKDLRTRETWRPKTVADLLRESLQNPEGETRNDLEIDMLRLNSPPIIEFIVATFCWI
ncbi:hypothetical protein OQA88_13323 [Cercophora sp. LCS_1]